jgi:hypothetical protein
MGEESKTVAAELLRNQATVETQLAHFADQVFARAMFSVILRGARRDFLVAEIVGECCTSASSSGNSNSIGGLLSRKMFSDNESLDFRGSFVDSQSSDVTV